MGVWLRWSVIYVACGGWSGATWSHLRLEPCSQFVHRGKLLLVSKNKYPPFIGTQGRLTATLCILSEIACGKPSSGLGYILLYLVFAFTV